MCASWRTPPPRVYLAGNCVLLFVSSLWLSFLVDDMQVFVLFFWSCGTGAVPPSCRAARHKSTICVLNQTIPAGLLSLLRSAKYATGEHHCQDAKHVYTKIVLLPSGCCPRLRKLIHPCAG